MQPFARCWPVLALFALAAACGDEAEAVGLDLAGAEFGHSQFFSGGSMTTVYAFIDDEAVVRRTMAGGGVGFGGSVSSDAGDHGTWCLRDGAIELTFGAQALTAVPACTDGHVIGLRIGRTLYPRTN